MKKGEQYKQKRPDTWYLTAFIVGYRMVTSELEANTAQGYTLFTDTEFDEAAHVLVTGLNAEKRSLEVEHQVVYDRFLLGIVVNLIG